MNFHTVSIDHFMVYFLAGVLVLGSIQVTGQDEFSAKYGDESSSIHPQFVLYHTSKDSSRIHYKVLTEELLYARKDKDAPFKAIVRLKFNLYDRSGGQLIDSTSTTITDIDKDKSQAEIIGEFKIPTSVDEQGMLKVITKDMNRGKQSIDHLEVDRREKNSRQNFLLFDSESGDPIFKNGFSKSGEVGIRTEVATSELRGRHYDRDFPLPPPPFSSTPMRSFNYEADSTFRIALNDSGVARISIPEKGFYHLRFDTLSKTGYTVYRFQKGFPEVSTVEAMFGPMRYLTSQREYNEIKETENLKAAVDEFWIGCGGSRERSRKLIRNFYNRVETANKHFTSYMEGWKTDRGLIYIIYGAPNAIKRRGSIESWVYGEENNMMSLTFTFERVRNPFTNNDYDLSRNQLYQTSWYRAVESWRNGRVYSN